MKGLQEIGFGSLFDLGSRITHTFVQFLVVRLQGKTFIYVKEKFLLSDSLNSMYT